MPAALTIHQRREIVNRRQTGESFASIARTMSVSYGAVRNIYHRFVETGHVTPRYDRCCHTEIRHHEAIYVKAVNLKKAHPGWGAGLIWSELAETFAEEDLPSRRTLQRWFQRAGVQKAPIDRNPKPFARRGKEAHEVWAIDAKEGIKLVDNSYASWLTITDEGSGAILSVDLFPHSEMDCH